MIGITSYGAYIPYYRLSRADIAKAWGNAPQPGEKAIASYDEDTLTMAVGAAMDCLTGVEYRTVDRVYFASVTPPYLEKQTAATIAAVLGLKSDTLTIDFCNSLRGGTNAIKVAVDAVTAGSAGNVLVCASDRRMGYPAGDKEVSLGDGAAALVIGKENVVATLENSYCVYDEILDVWRGARDTFIRSWEDRFVQDAGYTRVLTETTRAALEKFGLKPGDFSRVILYAGRPGQLAPVVGRLGFEKTQLVDALYSQVGDTGTASVLMSLVATLEDAREGDRILLVSYGNGCDALVLKVTGEIARTRNRRGIKRQLATRQAVSGYQKYLRWRELVEMQPPARPDQVKPSGPALWRDVRVGLSLTGVKCRSCGAAQYPAQRVCMVCRTRDNFEEYRFADKVGHIFTYSEDNLAAHPDPPAIVAAVDFPEGGRIMCDVTDCAPGEVKINQPVEMTFRKLYYAGGVHHYWWKCRPARYL